MGVGMVSPMHRFRWGFGVSLRGSVGVPLRVLSGFLKGGGDSGWRARKTKSLKHNALRPPPCAFLVLGSFLWVLWAAGCDTFATRPCDSQGPEALFCN